MRSIEIRPQFHEETASFEPHTSSTTTNITALEDFETDLPYIHPEDIMSHSSSSSDPTTLNIPSLLVFAVISVFAIRYFFFTTPSSSLAGSSGSSNGRRVPADRIEQVASMFPQVNRREIEYDLSRNGANVAATTERVLREGRLPMVSRVVTSRSKQANTG